MKVNIKSVLFLFLFFVFNANAEEEPFLIKTNAGNIMGFMTMPEKAQNIPLVIFVSGPDLVAMGSEDAGNELNSLKLLTEELKKAGIASYRIDKSSAFANDESKLVFDSFVEGLITGVDTFFLKKRFSKIIVAGRQEGVLIGILAAAKSARINALLSLGGYGRSGDEVMKESLAGPTAATNKVIFDYIEQLKAGDSLKALPRGFYPLFRPSIQPYLISWFKYKPTLEIKKMVAPVLIISGSTDLKTKPKDAQNLLLGKPLAEKRVIKNMNHLYITCDKLDKEAQKKSCSNVFTALNKEFVATVINFVNKAPKAIYKK